MLIFLLIACQIIIYIDVITWFSLCLSGTKSIATFIFGIFILRYAHMIVKFVYNYYLSSFFSLIINIHLSLTR